jgi:hypothetical protein
VFPLAVENLAQSSGRVGRHASFVSTMNPDSSSTAAMALNRSNAKERNTSVCSRSSSIDLVPCSAAKSCPFPTERRLFTVDRRVSQCALVVHWL